jgi:hypothetical protein
LIFDAISKPGQPKFSDHQIGFRNIRAEYSHSDIVLSLFGKSLCQCSYLSDLKRLKEKFSGQYFTVLP